MTNEQSATLLRLNKQAQVAALNAVGFSDITENSRASEFGQRIKWAAGLLDLNLACNRISDNSKWYFTREEWDSLTVTNKQLFIKRGLRIRAHGHSFVISAQECYNADMTTTFYWGGQGKAIDGLNQKGLGAMYGCFTGEEDTDLIIATLKDQNNSGVIGAPAAEAARAAVSFVERVRVRKFRREKRQDHKLGDAVAGGDGARRVRVIVQRDGALAAVVGVDHADAVCRAQSLPGREAAAREHAAEIPRRDGEGKPRADHGRRVRRDRDALPVRRAGVEIIARRVRAAAPRGDGAGAQLPDLHFHPFMPSQSTMCPAARVRFMSMMRWFSEPRKRRLRLRCAST